MLIPERDLAGIPRTGTTLEMTATVTHRIEHGKRAEKWSNKDVLGFLQQEMRMPSRSAGSGRCGRNASTTS